MKNENKEDFSEEALVLFAQGDEKVHVKSLIDSVAESCVQRILVNEDKRIGEWRNLGCGPFDEKV